MGQGRGAAVQGVTEQMHVYWVPGSTQCVATCHDSGKSLSCYVRGITHAQPAVWHMKSSCGCGISGICALLMAHSDG